ncbi:hypothetical protein V1638_16435 [Pseudarthrobacter sp. J64]|uniref:hypothetical protein n=1 Tax=Pseudarthrobacter sp. J64 TaxID=3116485 RepID=UPI002E813B0F|nr:hypothetical protein [Pseudarthrobacter sp. J64]MEE2570965.1 hypothetical protein [Pseudarthrobacter sp. J64]
MQHSSARAPFHALRAGMVGSAVVGLAVGAHVLGGGALPALPILLAIVALTGLASTTATRFQLNAPAMLAVLGSGQLVLHEALTVLGPAVSPPSLQPGHAGHSTQEHTELLASLAAAGQSAAEQGHGTGAAGLAMFLAHTAATLACAALMSRGEAALWALAAWLRPLVSLPEAVTFDAGHSPAAAGPPPSTSHRPWRNLRQDSRRGPPSAVAFS